MNNNKFFLFIHLLILFYFSVSAQTNTDSLLHSIEKLSDIEQIEILTEQCWEFRSKNPELAIKYGRTAIDIISEIESKEYYCEVYNYLGVIYGNLGKLDSAYQYYKNALEIAEEINDSTQIAYSYNNIGDYFYKSALFSIALENIYTAYQIFEKIGDKRGMGYTLNDIGEVYLRQNNYEKAQEYFIRSGEIRLGRNDNRGYAKSLLNQASTLAKLGEYENALETYDKALEYSELADYTKGKSWMLAGTADIYKAQNQFEKALENRRRALEIDLTIGNKYGEIINYNQIGAIYLAQNQFNNAEYYLKKALAESESTGHRDQAMISYNLLRELSLTEGNYKDGYYYLKEFENLEDSIFSQESSNKIADLQTAFMTERKDRENLLLKQEVAFEKETRNYFIVFSVLILGAVLLYILRYRSEKRANEKLNEVNKELQYLNAHKDKMFSIIGHDLKNPVGVIRSSLQMLVEDFDQTSENEKKEIITNTYKASQSLIDLLLELLEWGRLSRGLVEIEKTDVSINEIVVSVKKLLTPLASKKRIKIEIENCNADVYTDENMIKTVLRNFVSNAVKFTPHGGTVTISCNSDENNYYIVTKDTGVGIEPTKLNELFRIDKITTTTGTSNETGTGLGLIVANEFVKKCDGEILVESESGKGSEFTIKFPK